MNANKADFNLIHAHFFFVDIVGLSDPSVSTRIQIKKIQTLNSIVMNSTSFRFTPRDTMLVLPTGDGMAIGFLQGPELPLNLAIEIHKMLSKYNKAKIPTEIIRVRIGIHSGAAFVVDDVLNNKNIWGPGIILARRIMDIGDDGHILLSARISEDLREISDYYKQILRPVQKYAIKHGQTISLYSAHDKGFGNPRPPATKSLVEKPSQERNTKHPTAVTIYPYMEVNITIKNTRSQLVHYKRLYEIKNTSENPIYEVVHGIATDVEMNLSDLGIKVYDEDSAVLPISNVIIDKPYQKEFTTVFNRPIERLEKGRFYVLEYQVREKEKYFENHFGVDCNKFVVTIDYPKGVSFPAVYETDLETEKVKKCRMQPRIVTNERKDNLGVNSDRTQVRWAKKDITRGQCFRFEWK
ncbi:MAG: adenylate/guanylate cyclase domain-containing protein [Nitrososphaeraceae archaeon]